MGAIAPAWRLPTVDRQRRASLRSPISTQRLTRAGNAAMAATHSELARVNGLDMYYETVGRGKPLVLLHGALSTIETSFGPVLGSFAERREVIAPEQQAHGRTRDV